MKSVKTFSLIASWSLRIAVLLFMIANYWNVFKTIDFSHLSLFTLLAFIYCLFGILLFIGGFQKSASLSVISGLLIFLVSVYFLVINYKGNIMDVNFVIYIFPCAIGLYFFANGNK
ncbi:MAG TPA: hypothetical protein PKX15_01580 [Bacteroidales bacterium]|nr:hypothetical protein [Bacteroidales bacterium]